MVEYIDAHWMGMALDVNGFNVNARYFIDDLIEIFLPLINTFYEMKQKKDGRLIVYLAAPPGAGKTTLSLFFSRLSKTLDGKIGVQSVGIDGFHYPQWYIEKHSVVINGETIPMRDVKGSPETFDLQKLTDAVKLMQTSDTKWPVYDRNLHDVVQGAVSVAADIVIVEGNWLLLNEEGWRELLPLCDYNIFIIADECMLKDRLVQRKIHGGSRPDEASSFYEKSDRVNIIRALKNRLPSDCELKLSNDGKYHIINKPTA